MNSITRSKLGSALVRFQARHFQQQQNFQPARIQYQGSPVRLHPFSLKNDWGNLQHAQGLTDLQKLNQQAKITGMVLQITPHPALYKLDQNRYNQYFIARSGYVLFKFSPLLEFQDYSSENSQEFNVGHEEMQVREPQVFILGTQDLNSLFELQPQLGMAKGFPKNPSKSETVAMITHKRSFTAPSDDNVALDQCILTVQQKHGFIDEFYPGQVDEEKPTEDDWYYELKFQQFTPYEEVVPYCERYVRVKPTEMIHILELIKYSTPALHGWHAMYNPEVVSPGGGRTDGHEGF